MQKRSSYFTRLILILNFSAQSLNTIPQGIQKQQRSLRLTLFHIEYFTKMATITLPNDVILDVLQFVPYENGTKLVLTSKNWVKLLHTQLKEQRTAIEAEIRRLEVSDLGEKHREIKLTWNRLVQNERKLCANLRTNVLKTNGHQEQAAAIALFNQRLQTVKADMNAQYYEYCAIARKRQPIIDKILSLESKLDQGGESETERFADLKRHQERYTTAKNVILIFGTIVFAVALSAICIIIPDCAKERTLMFISLTLLIVSGIVVVLFLIHRKFDGLYVKLQFKVDRYENKKYVN